MEPNWQEYQEIISLQEIGYLDLQINVPDVVGVGKAKTKPVLRPVNPQEAALITTLSKSHWRFKTKSQGSGLSPLNNHKMPRALPSIALDRKLNRGLMLTGKGG